MIRLVKKFYSLVFSSLLIILMLGVTPTHSADSLTLLRLSDVSEAGIQPALHLLNENHANYQILTEKDISQLKTETVLLPIGDHLSDANLGLLETFLTNGGHLILMPQGESPDINVFKLFKDVDIYLSGSTFVSQTMDLRSRESSLMFKDFLPVGNRLLLLQASGNAKVAANWGGNFPALVTSSKGAVLNWDWGKELTPATNWTAMQYVLSTFGSTTALGNTAPPTTNTASSTTTPEKPEIDYGTYYKKMRNLDDYKQLAYESIENSIQLALPNPVKKAEQLILDADMHKARFESLYLGGDELKANLEFDEAKSNLVQALALASTSTKVEGRAIWLDRGSIVSTGSPDNLRELIRKLHQAGFNVIYFETLNAGFPMYNSKILPLNPLIKGWDPLKTAVEEGHKLGMEIHAWVWCFAVGNKKHNAVIGKPDDYVGPILGEKGLMSEALRMSGGGLVPPHQNEYWLSPASPRGRAFLKSVYSEIVSQYDVDGLQLDYIRYPFQSSGAYAGFEEAGHRRFQAETGMLINALDDYGIKGWVAWKTYQVSTFVQDVSTTLKKINPKLILSAAVFPMKRAERIMAIQQDWETWIDKGWIDTLSPMTYTSSPDELKRLVNNITSSINKQALIYPGIAIDQMDPMDLIRQLNAAKVKGGMGSTLFAMAHLDNAKSSALQEGPYKEKDILAPHRNPIKSMLVLLQDYQNTLSTLIDKKALSADSMAASEPILTHLKSMIGILTPCQYAPGNGIDTALNLSQSELKGVQQASQQWFPLEQDSHPYRVIYFTEELEHIDQLLNFTASKLGVTFPKEAPAITKAIPADVKP